jgi:AcrR family transcriptional regulator
MAQFRSEETHRHLLETAQRLFSQNGYEATGVAEICQAAGVSKGAFYHHFPTKQALFLELFNRWLAGIDMGMQNFCQSGQKVPQMLLQMTEVLPAIFQAADGHLPMFLEYWQQASRDVTIWEATIAPYHRYRQFFAGLIQQGIDEGSLRPLDVQAAAQVVLSLAVGLLLQGLLDPQGADWPQAARGAVELVLAGWQTSI